VEWLYRWRVLCECVWHPQLVRRGRHYWFAPSNKSESWYIVRSRR